jgi:hypothetical protein
MALSDFPSRLYIYSLIFLLKVTLVFSLIIIDEYGFETINLSAKLGCGILSCFIFEFSKGLTRFRAIFLRNDDFQTSILVL